MKLDRYKNHDIEIVIDRLKISKESVLDKRVSESIVTAMYHGEDVIMVLDNETNKTRYFSRSLMCPSSGISYPKPEPNNFSFNSPKGMCPKCKGLGKLYEVNLDKIVPNKNISINQGALASQGAQKQNWIFKQLELIAQRYNFKLTDPFHKIPQEAKDIIFYGTDEKFEVASKTLGITRNYRIEFEGIVTFIKNTFEDNESRSLTRWAKDFMDHVDCTECNGARLRKESLYFKLSGKSIADLAHMDILDIADWFQNLEKELSKTQLKIAKKL